MAYDNLCMYCFEDLRGQTTCPHCGRDARAAVPQIQMLPGSLVYHDRFLIGRALGQDATGIVYAAYDTKRENRLRIREYLPRDCAERLNDGAVVPIAGKEDEFEAGIRKLRASVESVEDPRKRHFFFEENGTAYIAQRKPAAAEPAEADEPDEDEESAGRGRVLLFAGIAVVVLVVAAVVLISLFNGALTTSRDITQSATLDPQQVWIPAESPTATPYVAPTFAALVDPELSWMDYTYEGDVEEEFRKAQGTATPAPTPRPTVGDTSPRYTLISGRSSAAEIRGLQERLAELGWLRSRNINGSYDEATRQAVRDYQSYVNTRYDPAQPLTVDGIAGPKTLQWLYEAGGSKPTPTPSPKVTPGPEISLTIKEGSPADEVRAVQRKLITLGLLPQGSADGVYGASTVAAVRRFQSRVNELQGYEALEVTGEMDPQSQAFLEYYVREWERLRKATAEPTAKPTASPKPTATPEPIATPESGVITTGSPAKAVRGVQQLLIRLGLLPEGSDDGVYGSATIAAVADFQQWVNAKREEQTLKVTGEVDPLTLAYLQYCVEHGLYPRGTAVPTNPPTVAPTEKPTQAPPTRAPEEPENPEEEPEIIVGPESDPDSIRYAQQLLIQVGVLPQGSDDGVYGSGTARAVRLFQEWVNGIEGRQLLEVTGLIDDATRQALVYAADHDYRYEAPAQPTAEPTVPPTAEPTAEPTAPPTATPTEEPENPEEEPEIVVGPESDPDSIRYVQQLLADVGLLPRDSDDGVYGSGTAEAVRRFQEWVNRVQGHQIVEVTGLVDDTTRRALVYASDHDFRYEAPAEPTAVPATEPPAPTEIPATEPPAPTEVPATEPPAEPTQAPTPEPTAAPTEAPRLGQVNGVDIAIGDAIAGEDVVSVTEDSFAVRWRADGEAECFYVVAQNGAGETLINWEATTETSFSVKSGQMTPGEVYTVRVGAQPVNGSRDDVVWQTARFMRPAAPTAEPEPTVGTVSAPSISIGGVAAGSSTIVIDQESFQISWTAEGDVQTYVVRINDSDGNDIVETQTTPRTGISVKASAMRPGVTYTITVGAVPVNGGQEDMQVSRAQFMLPQPTPDPTEEPTPDPTEAPTPAPTPARIGKPVINVGGTTVQYDGIPYITDSSLIVSWNAEGEVESYTIYVESQSGERQNLGTTTETSRTVKTQSLPAGLYTVYVGAMPVGGDEEDMQWNSLRFGIPAPTPEPTEVPTQAPTPEPPEATEAPAFTIDGPITGSSDAETIRQLQMKLYSLGLLSEDGLEPGVLDYETLRAVAEFQTRVNEEYGAELPVLDPEDLTSEVDVDTLRTLFSIR